MPQILSIRWRPSEGVTITRAGERAVSIEVSEHIGTRWETPSPALADALMCLNGGADESVMLDVLGEPGAAAVLYHNLGRLRHYGLLVAEVWSDERRLATLLPRARNFDPVLRVEPSREWQLSRFAYLRRDGNDLLLECPEAPCVLQIQDTELVAWIAEAAGPVTPAPGTAKAEISALLGQLGFFVDQGRRKPRGNGPGNSTTDCSTARPGTSTTSSPTAGPTVSGAGSRRSRRSGRPTAERRRACPCRHPEPDAPCARSWKRAARGGTWMTTVP